jgi:hypothetical protein
VIGVDQWLDHVGVDALADFELALQRDHASRLAPGGITPPTAESPGPTVSTNGLFDAPARLPHRTGKFATDYHLIWKGHRS